MDVSAQRAMSPLAPWRVTVASSAFINPVSSAHNAMLNLRQILKPSLAVVLMLALCPSSGSAQVPGVDPCTLIGPAQLRRLTLPAAVTGIRDSAGVSCQWGKIEDRQALVVKTFARMDTLTLERMRLAATRISDPLPETGVGDAAWSVPKPFGLVMMATLHGKAVQLQYYLKRRATSADRAALRAAAKVALEHL